MAITRNTYYTFLSDNGDDYQLSIIDTTAEDGDSTLVKSGGDGYSIDWQGDSSTGYTPIKSSMVSFSLDMSAYVLELVGYIITGDEKRFAVEISKKISGSYVKYWQGWLLRDEMRVPDSANETDSIEFKAVDGFGLLQDIEFSDFDINALTRQTFTEFFAKSILVNMPCATLGTTGRIFGQASVWYEDTHPYSSADDPLLNTLINEAAFIEVDSYGVARGKSLHDCLSQFLGVFSLEITQWNGVYLIIQQNTYVQAQTRAWYYDKDGAYVDSALINLQQTMPARLAGGSWQYLLPVKEVNTKYAYRHGIYRDNLLPYNVNENTAYGLGYSVQNYDLNIKGTIETHFTGTGTTSELIQVVYKLTVKNGSYYLKENADGELEWSTSSANYVPVRTRALKSVYASEQIAYTRFDITSPLPADDETITFTWTYWRLEEAYTGSLWTPPVGSTQTMTHDDVEGTFIARTASGASMEGSVLYRSQLTSSSVLDLELEETILGDGWFKYSAGALWVKDGGGKYYPSDLWTIYSNIGGTGYPVNSLRCIEAMALRRSVVKLYEGTFYGSPDIQKGFVWESEYYIWISINANIAESTYSGLAMVVSLDRTGVDAEDPLPEQDLTGGDGGSSSGSSSSTTYDVYWQRSGTELSPVTSGDDIKTSGELYAYASSSEYAALSQTGVAMTSKTTKPLVHSIRAGAGTNNGVQNGDNLIGWEVSTVNSSAATALDMTDIVTATENHTASARGVKRVIKTIRNTTTTLKERITITGDGEVVINEEGEPTATRIEGDTDSNLVNVDAVNDRVGISGDGTVDTKLHITTPATWGMESVKIEQQDEDKAFIDFKGTSSSGTDKNISTLVGDGGLVVGPYSAGVGGYGWEFIGMVKIEINGSEYWMPYYINTTE